MSAQISYPETTFRAGSSCLLPPPVPRCVVHNPPDGGAGHQYGEAAHQAVDPDQLEAEVPRVVDIVMVVPESEQTE